MTAGSRKALFWAPRALLIALTLFVSVFALDVFEEGHGFWQTAAGLVVHLIPSYILAGTLIVAWRREWIGTVVLVSLGVLFLWWGGERIHWFQVVFLAGPLFLAAALFQLNWLKRAELRAIGRRDARERHAG